MSERSGSSDARSSVWITATMIAVLLLGAFVLWHDLGTREVLGRDENATIIKLDQPGLPAVLHANGLKANGQPSSMQPLYFLVQHLVWPVIDHSAFLLRLLPSVFALLSIVFTFKLGQVLWRWEVGLVGALLVTVLPLHVQYGQTIRPYPLLCLLLLATAYFMLQGLRTNSLWHWMGFVVAAVLGVYTHLNASLALAAMGIFTAIVWLSTVASLWTRRKDESPATREEWLRRLVLPALAFVLVILGCIPAILRLLELRWIATGGQIAGEIRVELTIAFFYRYLYKIGLTSAWSRGLILGLMALGLAATLYRRRWKSALFAVLWLAVPFFLLSRTPSPRPFAERYLIFVPPVALLLAGAGIVAIGEALGALAKGRNARVVRWATIIAATTGLVLLFLPPLRAYFAANRASERLDLTIDVLEEFARPGDLIVISPRFFVQDLEVGGAEVMYLTEHLSPAELDALAAQYGRMWLLYTSFIQPVEMQEPLDQWVQGQGDEFARVRIKASTTLAYRNGEISDPEARLLDRTRFLHAAASVSADKNETWLRYNVLADTYQALSEVFQEQGKAELAAEYRLLADKARKTAEGQ